MAERYKIYEKLGAGGVGAVFRAYDSELKRWVAIKRLLSASDASGDAGTAAELRREADALASLRNPNIITIFDVATDAEGLFMVMELLEGEDLADVVSRGPLHYDDFKELASQTLEALLAAHQRHILHRDIKPENIKVERLPGGRMQSKIIDFGLARSGLRARKQTEDQDGTVMGSIYYMAPEQLTREPVDERTDLYALGCVFYEALSGRKAFDGDSMGTVIDAHINHDTVPLHVVAPHVPPWLGAWVLRLMAQKPDDRPANAQQAIEEFRAWEKMAAAPAMMPWMPMGYGGYAQPMPGAYPQHPGSGSDTVPLPGYYAQPQAEEDEAVYYAEAIVEAEPVVEIAAQTSQLGRPKTSTGRPPVSQPTSGMRGAPPSHLKRDTDEEPPSNAKRIILIAGGVLLVVGAGWFFLGRGSKPSKSGGSANQGLLASGGPPPVSFQLPDDRAYPPVSDDISLHLVATTGITAARKGADGKPAPAGHNEPVVEWHDLAPLGGDNLMRSFNGNPSNGPKRAMWRAATAGTAGVKASRTMLDFRARDGKPTAMNLTDVLEEKTRFPFGTGAVKGEPGLTLALVFQADSAKLPTRVFTLSGEGEVSVSFSVDAQKNLTVEFKNGASAGKILSKDVDLTQPSIAIVTWQASSGNTELRVRDALGKAFLGPGPKVIAPAEPLVHVQMGLVQNAEGQPAPAAEQFSGYAAEMVVHSSLLKTDQVQLMDKGLRDYYFQVPTAAPKPPAPKAPAPAPAPAPKK
ncbi:MAG: protein kinase [Prosthecobacter sp.]|nr:protein kinase [Prosthecobacter sp.]